MHTCCSAAMTSCRAVWMASPSSGLAVDVAIRCQWTEIQWHESAYLPIKGAENLM